MSFPPVIPTSRSSSSPLSSLSFFSVCDFQLDYWVCQVELSITSMRELKPYSGGYGTSCGFSFPGQVVKRFLWKLSARSYFVFIGTHIVGNGSSFCFSSSINAAFQIRLSHLLQRLPYLSSYTAFVQFTSLCTHSIVMFFTKCCDACPTDSDVFLAGSYRSQRILYLRFLFCSLSSIRLSNA